MLIHRTIISTCFAGLKQSSLKSNIKETKNIYAKYNINEKFFVLASPQYQYGLNGEEFRDFYAELNVGYKIDSSNVLLLTGSTENQTWITYKFKI